MRRTKIGIAGIVFVVLAAFTTASGAGVKAMYSTGDMTLFSIAVPDDWVLTSGRETDPLPGEADADKPFPRVIGLFPENNRALWIGFFSPPGISDLDAAEEYIRDLENFLVENPVVERQTDGLIDQRPVRYFRGTGIRNDKQADFAVALIQMPAGKVVIGLFVGENGARETYADQIDTIIKSFHVETGQGG